MMRSLQGMGVDLVGQPCFGPAQRPTIATMAAALLPAALIGDGGPVGAAHAFSMPRLIAACVWRHGGISVPRAARVPGTAA